MAIYVPNVAHITPILVPYIIKSKVRFQLFEFGKKLKKMDPPPQSKLASIKGKCRYNWNKLGMNWAKLRLIDCNWQV